MQIRDAYWLVDDGFGNLFEAAGSYYHEPKNKDAPLLHSHMMRMNYVGQLYYHGIAQINHH